MAARLRSEAAARSMSGAYINAYLVRKPEPQPTSAKLRTPSRCRRRVRAKSSVSMFGHQTCGYSVGDQETDVPSWLTVRG